MGIAPFPVDEAQIIGLFIESVLYGVYLITFFACMRVLLWRDGERRSIQAINMKMVIAALAMFIFGTMDVALGVRHNLDAFIYSQSDALDTFTKTSYWVNVMKMVNYVAQTFIGDSILIYRCWIVYDRSIWVTLLPTILLLGETACGIATCYFEAALDPGSLNSPTLIPFISGMLSLTLATNLLTTSLIVWRIWKVYTGIRHQRSMEGAKSGPLANLVRILIESGLLYTLSIVILFTLYMTSNNAMLGVSDAVVQIIGITFNLVITRVAVRKEYSLPTMPSFDFGRGRNTSLLTSSLQSQGCYVINIEKSVVQHHSPPDLNSTLDEIELGTKV